MTLVPPCVLVSLMLLAACGHQGESSPQIQKVDAPPPPPPPITESPCKRIPTRSLRLGTTGGDYFVLGKAPVTEQFFKGMLHLKDLKDHYEFSGSLNGKNEVGEAWAELCYGEMRGIEIKYASRSESTFCSIGADPDNNLRFTCGPVGAYDHEKFGLETWFGYNEPPH